MKPLCLDLFCGKFGWSVEFVRQGFRCVGIDIAVPSDVPDGCEFVQADVLELTVAKGEVWIKGKAGSWHHWRPDFCVASSPCEGFAVFGMRHFHPNPPYPEMGIRMFNHTRHLFESLGVPYVMENVRPAEAFVGNAVHHSGPFFLWGNAVPPLIPSHITKGMSQARKRDANGKRIYAAPADRMWSTKRKQVVAVIPAMIASCVASHAWYLIQSEAARA